MSSPSAARDEQRNALLDRIAAVAPSVPHGGRKRHGVVIAVLATLTAALLALLSRGTLAPNFASLFLGTIVLSAWYGERTGGLLATFALTVAFVYFLTTAPAAAGVGGRDAVRLAVFFLAGLLVTWGCTSLRVAQRRAEDDAAELALLSQQLADQTVELEEQMQEAQKLTHELALANQELEDAAHRAERARAAARAATREREHALALVDAVLTSAPIGFALLNRDLRYLRINHVLAEMHGVPPEDHIGRMLREIVPDVARLVEPALEQVLATEQPLLHRDLAGTAGAFPMRGAQWRFSFFPVRTSPGEMLGVGVIVVDVTAVKRLEE